MSSEYVRKIAAEEFSSQIAHVFSANDSPFGHVDCERVVSAWRGAFFAEAAGRPLSAVPKQAMVPVLRRFLGPTSYEQELSDILTSAYASQLASDAINAQLMVEDFWAALAPAHSPTPAVISKVELRKVVVGWVNEKATKGSATPRSPAGPMGGLASPTPPPPPQLAVGAASSPPAPEPHARLPSSTAAGSPVGRVTSPSSSSLPTSAARPPPLPPHNPAYGAGYPGYAYAAPPPPPPYPSPAAPPGSFQSPAGPPPATNAAGATPSSLLEAAGAAAAGAAASAFDPLRSSGSTLSALIAQATAAAHEHERALTATSEAAAGWQQRASAAEEQANQLSTAKQNLHNDLVSVHNERNAAMSHAASLEQRLLALEHAAAAGTQRERETEGKNLELESQLAERLAELRNVQQAHAVLQQQRLALEDELARTRAHGQAEAEAHAQAQGALRTRLDNERDTQAEAAREASLRQQSELDATRLELTTRLTAEQDTVGKLRDELRAVRLENERLADLRVRERAEADAALEHANEIHKASVSRLESKMAAAASQSALEVERVRKELAEERALAQEIVTDAKQETASAMAQTLEAREDALRWQRVSYASGQGQAHGNGSAGSGAMATPMATSVAPPTAAAATRPRAMPISSPQ